MIENKTILISPLDWGLGHATRCVPFIKTLSENNTVIIGVTDLNTGFFQKHFPEHQKIPLPSYNIRYSKTLPVWLAVLLQTRSIKTVIKKEHALLEQLIKKYNIDLVVSDNRFGLYNQSIESIFITHQLKISSPFFSKLANKINRNYLNSFNKIWVPDYNDVNNRLSGGLSDSVGIKIPVKYIGPKSALTDVGVSADNLKQFDYLILLSGIEPQRGKLENLLLERFKNTSKKIMLIRGNNSNFNSPNRNINVVNFAFDAELKNLILNSETIICRSGYSTLMDLHLLGKKKLVLIPTPGQTEQEYLAKHWAEKFNAIHVPQGKVKNYSFR